ATVLYHVPLVFQALNECVHVSNQMAACPWPGSQRLGQPAVSLRVVNSADAGAKPAGYVGAGHGVEVVKCRSWSWRTGGRRRALATRIRRGKATEQLAPALDECGQLEAGQRVALLVRAGFPHPHSIVGTQMLVMRAHLVVPGVRICLRVPLLLQPFPA